MLDERVSSRESVSTWVKIQKTLSKKMWYVHDAVLIPPPPPPPPPISSCSLTWALKIYGFANIEILFIFLLCIHFCNDSNAALGRDNIQRHRGQHCEINQGNAGSQSCLVHTFIPPTTPLLSKKSVIWQCTHFVASTKENSYNQQLVYCNGPHCKPNKLSVLEWFEENDSLS